MQSLRRRLHFLKHAVDPEPDAKFLIERLEVNVAGAEPMRFDQQHRDQANDRRVRFVGLADVAAFRDLQAEIDVVADLLRQDVGRFVGRAVIFDQGLRIFSGLAQTSSISRCNRKLRLSIVSMSSGSPTATISPVSPKPTGMTLNRRASSARI